MGRFLTIDAVPGVPPSPQSWNRYGYAANSPVNYRDADGNATPLQRAYMAKLQNEMPDTLSEVLIIKGEAGIGVDGDEGKWGIRLVLDATTGNVDLKLSGEAGSLLNAGGGVTINLFNTQDGFGYRAQSMQANIVGTQTTVDATGTVKQSSGAGPISLLDTTTTKMGKNTSISAAGFTVGPQEISVKKSASAHVASASVTVGARPRAPFLALQNSIRLGHMLSWLNFTDAMAVQVQAQAGSEAQQQPKRKKEK